MGRKLNSSLNVCLNQYFSSNRDHFLSWQSLPVLKGRRRTCVGSAWTRLLTVSCWSVATWWPVASVASAWASAPSADSMLCGPCTSSGLNATRQLGPPEEVQCSPRVASTFVSIVSVSHLHTYPTHTQSSTQSQYLFCLSYFSLSLSLSLFSFAFTHLFLTYSFYFFVFLSFCHLCLSIINAATFTALWHTRHMTVRFLTYSYSQNCYNHIDMCYIRYMLPEIMVHL